MRIHPRPSASKVKELLAACNLPASDLVAADFEHFFGCGRKAAPKGVVGLALYGKVGLLRSLAVEQAARGQGCGSELVREAEKHAAANGVETLYLLTIAAEDFFRSQGYVKIARASLPEAIQRSAQYSTLCPATSTAMVKHLKA